MAAPQVTQPIPPQLATVGQAFGPLDLKNFIQDAESKSPLTFSVTLEEGKALPSGFICTPDGILTGQPIAGTEDEYTLHIIAKNQAGQVEATTAFVIQEAPEFSAQSVTPLDVYYLLERWATLIVWNAEDLESVGEPHELTLKEANPHFHFYDRGSALVTVPKSLVSHERTLRDALDATRVLAKEVYRRGWTVEMAGFEKMARAFWVAMQHLEDQHGKSCKVLHYEPSLQDQQIYLNESQAARQQPTVQQ